MQEQDTHPTENINKDLFLSFIKDMYVFYAELPQDIGNQGSRLHCSSVELGNEHLFLNRSALFTEPPLFTSYHGRKWRKGRKIHFAIIWRNRTDPSLWSRIMVVLQHNKQFCCLHILFYHIYGSNQHCYWGFFSYISSLSMLSDLHWTAHCHFNGD